MQWPEQERLRLIRLLGGTHDDRAAVALRAYLPELPDGPERLAAIAALAELGFYTKYHSSLLLREVQTDRLGDRAWQAATMLAQIHHPEAVWAQNQLYSQHLVDGALSGVVRPLLKFRTYALFGCHHRK